MTNNISNKIKIGLVILGMGGSMIVGTAIDKPECDYVIVGQDAEICLSEEQVETILEQLKGVTGFGGFQFEGGINPEKLIKKK